MATDYTNLHRAGKVQNNCKECGCDPCECDWESEEEEERKINGIPLHSEVVECFTDCLLYTSPSPRDS